MSDTNAPVSLEEALTLLEISDISALGESDLNKIRKRAMRRWHPDKIAHTQPDPEVIAEYEHNFKRIDAALDRVRAFLNGETASSHRTHGAPREETIQPEEAVRKYATHNQETVSANWEDVQAKSFEMEDEDVVLTEGISVAEALDEDLRDKVPGTAVYAFGAGVLLLILAIIPIILIGIVSETLASVLTIGVMVLWGAQALSCVALMLPLSRFWLPPQAADAAVALVDRTLEATAGWSESTEGPARYANAALNILAALAHWLVAVPLYKIGGLFFRDKVIGRNVVRMRYYSGFAKDYIEQLIAKDTTAMTLEELFHLSALSGRFSAMRR